MNESLHVETGASTDDSDFIRNVERAQKTFADLDPNTVVCTMGIAVSPAGVTAFALGNDFHIAKMLSTLANVVRDGLEQANNPPDHSNEVKH